MTFSEALEKCKQGARISRGGWNGKGQFVYFQPGSVVPAGRIRTKPLQDWMSKENVAEIEIIGHFDIRTTNGKVQCGWLATQSDLQADDWQVV